MGLSHSFRMLVLASVVDDCACNLLVLLHSSIESGGPRILFMFPVELPFLTLELFAIIGPAKVEYTFIEFVEAGGTALHSVDRSVAECMS